MCEKCLHGRLNAYILAGGIFSYDCHRLIGGNINKVRITYVYTAHVYEAIVINYSY